MGEETMKKNAKRKSGGKGVDPKIPEKIMTHVDAVLLWMRSKPKLSCILLEIRDRPAGARIHIPMTCLPTAPVAVLHSVF
jgi:hypothetical protein